MSKLDNYNGTVLLMAGLSQIGGDYPLMEAHAVQTREDGTRLDEELEILKNSPGGGGGGGTIVTVNGSEVARFNADTKADKDYTDALVGYDLVLDSSNYTGYEQIIDVTAKRIKVIGVTVDFSGYGEFVEIPSSISKLDFSDCTIIGDTISSVGSNFHFTNCTLNLNTLQAIQGTITGAKDHRSPLQLALEGAIVTDCKARFISPVSAYDCEAEEFNMGRLTRCDGRTFKYCTSIHSCYMLGGSATFDDCQDINGVTIAGSGATFTRCKNIQNVLGYSSGDISYINCTNVDFNTCEGFVKEEENGKVPVLKADGTFEAKPVYSTDEVDGIVGDIDTALDNIISIQSALIGGEA